MTIIPTAESRRRVEAKSAEIGKERISKPFAPVVIMMPLTTGFVLQSDRGRSFTGNFGANGNSPMRYPAFVC